MTTSLLFHVFGLRDQELLRTDFKYSAVTVKVKTKEDKLQCSHCQSWRVIKSGTKERLFRGIPIGSRPVYIIFKVQRLECKQCGRIRQEKIKFAKPKALYLNSFRRYILELSKIGTIADVADHLGIGWDVVKDIQKEYLLKNYAKPNLENVEYIAIDEFAIEKGHKYMTVVYDLESGVILYAAKGKDAESLDGFWRRLKKKDVHIKAAAIDMSPAYISAVTNNLPETQIVFDRFHIKRQLNDQITKLRKDLYRQETDLGKRDLLKGTRWLLLKNKENLDNKKQEQERLREALDVNRPLAIAYYMKEELDLIWEQDNREQAEKVLGSWVAKAFACGVPRLKKFANSLLAHRSGIFAWYDHPISTGPLEGINNKIKTMKRQAYGFRDDEFFILKLYSLHEKTYALTG
jgi:transposase